MPLNWVGGRLTHGLGADSAGGPRVENQKACPSHAGGCEGRDSVVEKRYLEWEEPDWQGSGHNSHVLALVNIARVQPAELSVCRLNALATEVKSGIEQDTRKSGRRYMRTTKMLGSTKRLGCSIRRCYQAQGWSVGTRNPAGILSL
jgi:hypothetical protein